MPTISFQFISFQFSCPRSFTLLVIVIAAITTLTQCVLTDGLAAQSTVREVNTTRSTLGSSTLPFSTRAGRGTETGSISSRATENLDEAYFDQYELQLNAILKTRRDEEKDFIKAIVEQIEAGNLTTRLVNTSFKWVRNKRPNVKNSFVYFERVLRILATRQGVGEAVPAFDPNVYNVRPATRLRGGNP